MPTGLDEQYTWMSLATLVGFVMIAWDMMITRQAELSPKPASLPAAEEKQPEAKQPEPAAAKAAQEEVDSAESEKQTAEPVWRARMERRKQGKRRRNR